MKTAWVVDDDAEMRRAISLMLELMDYKVELYRDARTTAKSLLGGSHPDVMILDILMPEVSGIDLLDFVRQRDEFKEIPIVMLSSETDDIQVDEAMGLGANAFIFKPVSIDELEAVLKKVVKAP